MNDEGAKQVQPPKGRPTRLNWDVIGPVATALGVLIALVVFLDGRADRRELQQLRQMAYDYRGEVDDGALILTAGQSGNEFYAPDRIEVQPFWAPRLGLEAQDLLGPSVDLPEPTTHASLDRTRGTITYGEIVRSICMDSADYEARCERLGLPSQVLVRVELFGELHVTEPIPLE